MKEREEEFKRLLAQVFAEEGVREKAQTRVEGDTTEKWSVILRDEEWLAILCDDGLPAEGAMYDPWSVIGKLFWSMIYEAAGKERFVWRDDCKTRLCCAAVSAQLSWLQERCLVAMRAVCECEVSEEARENSASRLALANLLGIEEVTRWYTREVWRWAEVLRGIDEGALWRACDAMASMVERTWELLRGGDRQGAKGVLLSELQGVLQKWCEVWLGAGHDWQESFDEVVNRLLVGEGWVEEAELWATQVVSTMGAMLREE